MAYDMQVLTDEGIIKISHSGDVDIAEKKRARMDAAALSEAKKINRILVDNRKVSSTFRMTEHFVFNASHNKALPGNIKIGIVFQKKTSIIINMLNMWQEQLVVQISRFLLMSAWQKSGCWKMTIRQKDRRMNILQIILFKYNT